LTSSYIVTKTSKSKFDILNLDMNVHYDHQSGQAACYELKRASSGQEKTETPEVTIIDGPGRGESNGDDRSPSQTTAVNSTFAELQPAAVMFGPLQLPIIDANAHRGIQKQPDVVYI
jgi:hypothetical protein